MPYVTLDDIRSLIPGDFLTQALDDDSDGAIDAWDYVAEAASRAVDAHLGVRYTVPFAAPAPAIVTEAAVIFAAEACYIRRGIGGKENPFADRARLLRDTLAKIAAGDLPLDPGKARARPSVSLITETSRTSGEQLSL
jgi:phage gp36-like protein